jgi:hypothetical protein
MQDVPDLEPWRYNADALGNGCAPSLALYIAAAIYRGGGGIQNDFE